MSGVVHPLAIGVDLLFSPIFMAVYGLGIVGGVPNIGVDYVRKSVAVSIARR